MKHVVQQLLGGSIRLLPWGLRVRLKDVPIAREIQRAVFNRYLQHASFMHTVTAGPAKGLRYPITMPQDKLIWTGTYEAALSQRIVASIQRGAVCFDIGGYRGFFSGVMGLAGASKVYVFEPFPENATQIRRVLAANPGLPIELREVAIAECDGTTEFNVMPDASMGKLSGSPFQAAASGVGRISVRTCALDGLVRSGSVSVPHVIKIDVEGAEVGVLEGASEVLARHKPALFIEAHSRDLAMQCSVMLARIGYSVSVLETGAPVDGRTEPEVCHLEATAR